MRYVSLLRFTAPGARMIHKSTARAEAFRKQAQKAGVKAEALYWTAGAYDGVLILSADDESKALHCPTRLARAGNVRTETLPAYDSEQFRAIANPR